MDYGTFTAMLVCVILLISLSPLSLARAFKVEISTAQVYSPFWISVLALLLITQLRDFSEAVLFFTAALLQFVSFVFVSRMRQRGSFSLHAIAGLASNGTWFLTVHILDMKEAYWLLVIPYMAGIVVGRMVGVMWTQYIEEKYNLEADATRDPKLAPGKQLRYLSREPMFWTLLSSLGLYIVYGFMSFNDAVFSSMFVVIGLGVLQNLFYALNTRAMNRGSVVYIALTGVLAGSMFFVSAAYLFSQHLPFELLIPYVLGTVLGSGVGAFFSMLIEFKSKLAPDAHVKSARLVSASAPQGISSKRDGVGNYVPKFLKHMIMPKNSPFVGMCVLILLWVFLNEQALALLGYTTTSLVLPFPVLSGMNLSREAVLLSATMIFLLNNALHTVVSRAGNRNHVGYHITATVMKGLVDFFALSYLVLNASILDVLPIAVLASCLGSLFGKEISEFIEIKLGAVMDIRVLSKT